MTKRRPTAAELHEKALADYRKDRELWLAQQEQDKQRLPAVERKVDELSVRFDRHLEDEQEYRKREAAAREKAQADNAEWKKELKGDINEILTIKRSTEFGLKVFKWLLGVSATIAAIWKTGVLHAIFHRNQ